MSFTCSTRKPPPKRQWRSQRLAMRSKQRTSRAPHLPAIYTTRSAHARVERVGGISSSTRRRASSRSPCLGASCRHPRHRASSPCNRLMQRMRLRAPGWLYYCTLTRNKDAESPGLCFVFVSVRTNKRQHDQVSQAWPSTHWPVAVSSATSLSANSFFLNASLGAKLASAKRRASFGDFRTSQIERASAAGDSRRSGAA